MSANDFFHPASFGLVEVRQSLSFTILDSSDSIIGDVGCVLVQEGLVQRLVIKLLLGSFSFLLREGSSFVSVHSGFPVDR